MKAFINAVPRGGLTGGAGQGTANFRLNVLTPNSSNHKTQIDLSKGLHHQLILSAATASADTVPVTDAVVQKPSWTGMSSIAAGASFWLHVDQDATGGWLAPGFTTGATKGCFAIDVPLQSIDGTPLTRTTYMFVLLPSDTGILTWCLVHDIRTGYPITGATTS